MFLKEIQLTHFKCHENLWLSFATGNAKKPVRKTTLMLGENGTGKTALLQAIALVTGGSAIWGSALNRPDEWIQQGKEFCEIAAVILNAQKKEQSVKLRINRNDSAEDIMAANQESLQLIDNASNAYFVAGYGANRYFNKSRENSTTGDNPLLPRFAPIQSLFDWEAQLAPLSAWALKQQEQHGAAGWEVIKKALNVFLTADIKLKANDPTRRTLMFATPDGDMPLEQLSDGYQKWLAWLSDLLFHLAASNNKAPLKSSGLLLVDAIDLQLHPIVQRQLYGLLQKHLPHLQIIATAYSPLTAQQAEVGELYALQRTNKKTELLAFKGAPSNLLLHQLLMSPVFGLVPDESVRVEQAKDEIRTAKLQENATGQGDNLVGKSSQRLTATTPLNVRTNSLLSEEDVELLQTINTQLKKKKG
jgi:predicted ATP-binding protein involved in virulence